MNKKIDTKFNKDILDGFGAERIANLIVEKSRTKIKKIRKKRSLKSVQFKNRFYNSKKFNNTKNLILMRIENF